MITCNLQGGLGNQLFQIFTTIAYALKEQKAFLFELSDKVGKRNTYWETFLNSIKKFTKKILIKNVGFIKQKETGFHYAELESINSNDILLIGYFQSYKYFEKKNSYICNLLELEKQQQRIKEKYKEYNYSNSVSIHFRYGDYKNLQYEYTLLPYEYYKQSLQYILERDAILDSIDKIERNILYFCQAEDNEDVNKIRINLAIQFPNCTFTKVDDVIEDWEQMLIMSCCENNIIANSTFSWWGAYFNQNPEKKVCYPEVWFGAKYSHYNTRDLFPDNWNCIHFSQNI